MKQILQLILVFSLFIMSCEDPVPTDYEKEYVVQSYLLVDEPIQNLLVMQSLPVQDSFDLRKALISDAEVTISVEGQEFALTYNAQGDSSIETAGYFYDDITYKVKPSSKYDLKIRLKDGTLITGTTTTPARINWVKDPNDYLYYPEDLNNLPTNDTIQWSPISGNLYYLLSIKTLDTIEYGKYYDKASPDEKNERIMRPWGHDNDRFYKNRTSWALIPNTRTPVVWSIFKWYGLHEAAVFCPDANMLQWFIQHNFTSQYNPMFTTVDGAIGVFGSASVARDTSFVVKNKQ